MIIEKTESWCSDCRGWHDAVIRSEGLDVFFVMECPVEFRRTKISSDANVYLDIRKKNGYPQNPPEASNTYSWSHRLEISRACNGGCPVCYVSAEAVEKPEFLSPEAIGEISSRLKKRKRKLLTLSGGEPTLSDHLPDLIRAVRRAGLKVSVLTNGIRMAREKGYARSLTDAGLNYCFLQFDSLDDQVHPIIRGKASSVDMKKAALKELRETGMKYGINTVLVKENLYETTSLLNYFKTAAPTLNMVCLLVGNGSTGRFELSPDSQITREDVIRSLVESSLYPGITSEDFWPLPFYRPLGLAVHPDCAVLLPLAVEEGRWLPLKELLDIKKLYLTLGKIPGPLNLLRGDTLFLVHAFRCCRKGQKRRLLRLMKGYRSGEGSAGLYFVVIEQFLGRYYQDRRRLERCSTMQVYRDGSLESLCRANAPDIRISGYLPLKKVYFNKPCF